MVRLSLAKKQQQRGEKQQQHHGVSNSSPPPSPEKPQSGKDNPNVRTRCQSELCLILLICWGFGNMNDVMFGLVGQQQHGVSSPPPPPSPRPMPDTLSPWPLLAKKRPIVRSCTKSSKEVIL